MYYFNRLTFLKKINLFVKNLFTLTWSPATIKNGEYLKIHKSRKNLKNLLYGKFRKNR